MCDTMRSRLIAWIDGELENDESAAVADHVAQCWECAREVRNIRALSRDIAEFCVSSVGSKPRRYWIPAAIAAAAAIVLATGLVWTRVQQQTNVVTTKQPTRQSAAPLLVARNAATPDVPPVKPAPARRRTPPRPAATVTEVGKPGVTVVIPLDEVLPVGAAPPGALLVGNLTFDAGGQPSRIQLQ